jgi:hypothetical protein
MCERVVALDAANRDAAKNFRFLCVDCYLEHFDETPISGGLVGGEFYAEWNRAMLAAKAHVEKN